MANRTFLLFLFFSCFYFAVSAQQFGGNPPSVKWQQVNSSASRVIFEKGLDSTALRVANLTNWLTNQNLSSIGNHKRKVNIVLQNQTTISNAYVALAPFRSEFFLTPTQNSFEIGSLPWPDQLAIHEYRHVQQYNNFDVGISKLLRILFGEDGQALANGASIPNWFFEGDAVYNETKVSNQGRGRLSYFFNPYRSLWATGKTYSWMKLRNGSYHDFIPDHYALGYLLVAYGTEKYGDEFWRQVTHDAAAFKGLIYPFQAAIKKYSGKDYYQFRTDAINYFKDYFHSQDPPLSAKKVPYRNEEYPVHINEKEILFVSSGYNLNPSFVIRSDNGDRTLRTKDISLDNHFSYRNGKIVYASYKPDIRWRYKDYSDLRIVYTSTGEEQQLTNNTKYFSPDINDEGDKVVAVNITASGKCFLHILSVPEGKVIQVIPNPENLFYTYPKFYSTNKIVSCTRNNKGEMSLQLINLTDGSIEYLTPSTYNVIGFPSISNDTIYFTAQSGNQDRLFAITMKFKNPYELIPSKNNGIGQYYVSEYNGKLNWSVFTASGYKLNEETVNAIQWKPAESKILISLPSTFGVTKLNNTYVNELGTVPQEGFSISKYHKGTGLFNFHSIQPYISDPEYTLNLLGENILNTFESDLSVTYNRAEQWKRVGLSLVYGSLFPYLNSNLNYTIDRKGLYHGKVIYWNEVEPSAGISVLLDLSKNRSVRNLRLGSNYTYNQTDFQGAFKDSLGRISYSYLNNFISFSNQLQMSRQQIFPTLAQTFSVSYKTAVTHYYAHQFTVNASLFLPGLIHNHSLVLNGAFLQKDTIGKLDFSSDFPFSRGYTSFNLYQMIKWGATYHLPLVYPDAGLADIVYFLRVRGDVFYDHTHVNDFYSNGAKFAANFKSVGTEIYFDTKWWNQVPLTFGIRYSRLLDPDIFAGSTGRNRWEFILPVNIFNQ